MAWPTAMSRRPIPIWRSKDLDARQIPYQLLTFPDEGHGIYKAGNRARWLARDGRISSPRPLPNSAQVSAHMRSRLV